nr:alcohol dehydrogenase catalytic domain-containing protein [Actinomadura rudentiformis]
MKAVVWHGVGKISLDEIPNPQIREPGDAIVRITTSAICGTDLHFVRGTCRACGRVPCWVTKRSARSRRSGHRYGTSSPVTGW